MTGLAEQRSALEPLRAALLSQAQAGSDAVRADADADGELLLVAARDEADRLLSRARAQGEVEAAARQAVEQARTRRAARAVVLAAQREAYDELVRQARVAVGSLLEDPATRTRLEAVVRRRLGDPDATVVPHPDGGLVGETADGRRVDASVAALVDSALTEIDVEQLWATR